MVREAHEKVREAHEKVREAHDEELMEGCVEAVRPNVLTVEDRRRARALKDEEEDRPAQMVGPESGIAW